MLDNDLLRQLLTTFAVEAQEHVQAINRHLLALETAHAGHPGQRDDDSVGSLLAEVFREAHSLKGAARAVSLMDVEMLAHRLETLFGRIKSGELQSDARLFDLAYRTLDAITELVQAATTGEASTVDVASLGAALQAAGEGHAVAPPEGIAALAATAADPDSSPEPVHDPDPGPPIRTIAASVPEPTPAVRPSAAEPAPRLVDETVRIATAKLDALMAQVSELQVTGIGLDQRLIELSTLADRLDAWETEWRKVYPHYRRILLASDGLPGGLASTNAPDTSLPAFSGRDPASPAARKELDTLLEFLDANRAYLRTSCAQLGELRRQFRADTRRIGQVSADLRDGVRRTRMLPVSAVFDLFPRMVRDLARQQGKEVRFVVHGAETEVDRSVLEQIKDPLTHLLRNSLDHGLETPQARLTGGKPREGTITLTASQRGDMIAIELADDGAGIDLSRVRASAVKKGFLSAEAAAALSDQEAMWLIFRSGLSTSPIITDLSGRGVGLDVVRENVERLHGLMSVDSQPGRGTRFSLHLPLTVTSTVCLLVQAGGQTFALPTGNITHIVQAEEFGHAEGRAVLYGEGRPVAVVHLAEVLGLAVAAEADPRTSATARRPAIIVGSAEKRAAFLVDGLLGVQEVVVKSLPAPLLRVRHVAGATILGTGEVVVILNVTDLLRSVARTEVRPAVAVAHAIQEPKRQAVILVADDSITTRTLEKNILEAAGYAVRTAADGVEAWTVLQTEGCDLLVSDVNMPRMDGFALTARARGEPRFSTLPVILVTSLDSREDRERGIESGADAYVVKSAFDQDSLLATIRRLI